MQIENANAHTHTHKRTKLITAVRSGNHETNVRNCAIIYTLFVFFLFSSSPFSLSLFLLFLPSDFILYNIIFINIHLRDDEATHADWRNISRSFIRKVIIFLPFFFHII